MLPQTKTCYALASTYGWQSERTMAQDTRYLQRHGRQYRVVIAVPRSVQRATGSPKLLKASLHTDSLPLAQAKRWPVVSKLKQKLADMAMNAGLDNPIWREASEWFECHDMRAYLERKGEPSVTTAELNGMIQRRASEIGKDHGATKAEEFTGIATGTATPLLFHSERWLQESGRKDRTKGEDRYALRLLDDWATRGGWPRTVEGLTRKVAADFISECFIESNTHPKTAKKRISSLSSYWKWLALKGLLGTTSLENPWPLQPYPTAAKRTAADKRPFTDDEVAMLLYAGQPDPRLSDFMRIAALSGLREDEIACLTVADCSGGMFRVRDAKTQAGDRTLPTHSKLATIVARRTKGKQPNAWLFEELPGVPDGSKSGRRRYMPLSKQFLRYRQALGVDERPEGNRQSNIDFHSFRRWFCAKAEHAGIPETTTAAVVGHKRKGMSYGRYSKGPSIQQLRTCVEAVKLPSRRRT